MALVLSGLLYYYQGFQLSRDNFEGFFSSYMLLFALFYWLWLNRQNFSFAHFFWISIGFRVILILSVPALSNDFFRFIWDGELITNGVNPYAHKPDELISFGGFLDQAHMRTLYHGMGELSQQSYSCYPPLNQLFFAIPASVSNSLPVQVALLKVIMILADVGIIVVAKKIALHLKTGIHYVWLFALNPFIILEFTGNLHFEGVMIFFMLCGIYLLLKNQWIFSTVFFAFAIQTKLIPLIILPLLWKKLGLRRMIAFTAISAILILLIGSLFLNDIFLGNMLDSIDQYFEKFEFNASVFYVIREVGFMTVGYDAIQLIMPVMTKIILVSIILIALFRRYRSDSDLLVAAMFSFLVFYAFSTTVHPWYISLILICSVFTTYRFPLIWSLLVMVSYSAYAHADFAENTWFLLTEYVVLYSVLIFEIRQRGFNGLFNLQPDKLIQKN